MFSAPEIDRAIDRNIEAIAHVMAALMQEDLAPGTREHLLLAKSVMTSSNRNLSRLLDACGICGRPGLKRVCAGCGARKVLS